MSNKLPTKPIERVFIRIERAGNPLNFEMTCHVPADVCEESFLTAWRHEIKLLYGAVHDDVVVVMFDFEMEACLAAAEHAHMDQN